MLLEHICANSTAKNVKEIVRVLMPFVHGAIEGIKSDNDKVKWIFDKCQVLNTLFEKIVLDEAMIQVLNKELFWKNVDTCLVLLLALKS